MSNRLGGIGIKWKCQVCLSGDQQASQSSTLPVDYSVYCNLGALASSSHRVTDTDRSSGAH